jgi:hypothetical protein
MPETTMATATVETPEDPSGGSNLERSHPQIRAYHLDYNVHNLADSDVHAENFPADGRPHPCSTQRMLQASVEVWQCVVETKPVQQW